MVYYQRRMSCNPYLVVSVVHPQDLPDDIMQLVKNEVSNGRESIAELEKKIDKKALESRKVGMKLQRGEKMLALWQNILIDSEKNGESMLDEAKSRVEGFKAMITETQNDLKKINAEIEELEQQVKDEPKMRDMHRKLFQNNT